MSLYDTENLMQKCAEILAANSPFLDADLFEDEMKVAAKLMEEYDPIHHHTANKYIKKEGGSNKTKLDLMFGIDNIMDCELEDGSSIFLGIDWTDNPDELARKRDRFVDRREILDSLDIDKCLAVCLSNQVLLPDTKLKRVRFIYNSLTAITEKVEDMVTKNKYSGYLNLDMSRLI